MIPKINKILYATDLSSNSAYAFRYAVNSAEKHNARITILHVLDKLSSNTQALVSSHLTAEQQLKIFEDKISYTSERIRKRLEIFCEKELKKEPEMMNLIDSIQVKEGFPAEEILQTSEDLRCDAIVIGTHGKGIIKNTFLGSTSKRVLRRTRKPVFIIPIPKEEIDMSIHDEQE
jgi:nucleotide-binding universal stress UspA family protein